MPMQWGPTKIGAMQYNGVNIGEAMMNGQVVYRSGPPVVRITGTVYFGYEAQDQFRQACIDHGTTYQDVTELPFILDTSGSVTIHDMFRGCTNLVTVPPMDTSNVTSTYGLFASCTNLVTVPPMDTSNVNSMSFMFTSCTSLTSVPDLHASSVEEARRMFRNCTSLTDGNVRLIGKHPSVATTDMIIGSGLTREPFYDTNGNPI